MKTAAPDIRFTDLVKESGQPQVVTLWADPKKDDAFTKLVKQRRILTLLQKPTGTKKDFGYIGFHPQAFAAYIAFPRRLAHADLTRVIGIKYELLGEKEIPAADRYQPKPPKPAPKIRQDREFSITIRRTASLTTTLQVLAKNKLAAKQAALAEISGKPFLPKAADVVSQVAAITENKN